MTPHDEKLSKAYAAIKEVLKLADANDRLCALLGEALECGAVVLVCWRNDGRCSIQGQAHPQSPPELDAEVHRVGEALRTKVLNYENPTVAKA